MAIKCVMHESTSWTLHPIERWFLTKNDIPVMCRVRSYPRIQHCNPSVITNVARHRFECPERAGGWRHGAYRRMRGASRSPLTSEWIPAKSDSPWNLCLTMVAYRARNKHDHTASEDARDCRPRRGGCDEHRRRLSWVDYTDNDVKSGSD